MNLIATPKGIINLEHLVKADYTEPDAAARGPWLKLTLTSLTIEKDCLGYDGEDPVAVATSDVVALYGAEADAMWKHLNEAAIVLTVEEA